MFVAVYRPRLRPVQISFAATPGSCAACGQFKAVIACETSRAFPADLATIAIVKRFGRCRRSRVDPVLNFRLIHLNCMQ